MSGTFWLVERGQAEGFDPPVYYATHGSKTKWTGAATLAVPFESKADAELFINHQLDGTGITARAVEHAWFAQSAPADGGLMALDELQRYTAMVNVNGAIHFVVDDKGKWVLFSQLAARRDDGGLREAVESSMNDAGLGTQERLARARARIRAALDQWGWSGHEGETGAHGAEVLDLLADHIIAALAGIPV